ncbi:hypothetical protein [Streptomyces sp. NPDC001389]|uniref:hypothetical protein n=1 Tax=Streptomyces sp. NPDC001389 TaxID=3364569 RepID=UPI0036B39B8F
MRQLALREPDLPVELLRTLPADPDGAARRASASRPRLPDRALTRLLADTSAHAAAATPRLPTPDSRLPTARVREILDLGGL